MPPPLPPINLAAGLKTILVIDDDAPLRETLVAALEIGGYRVLHAGSADAGLALARTHLPDVVLCDIDMPGKSGHRLLQEMRADPILADRQFVLMTGNAAFAQPRQSMDLGADDFLLKPFTLVELIPCVAARLERAAISRRVEDRAIDELRTSLHSTLPHEFFTPLAGVLGLTDLLDEDLEALRPEEARKILQDIRHSCRRLHRTLRNYLFILDLDQPGATAPAFLFSADVVAEAVTVGATAAAERHARAADLTLDLQGAPVCTGPAELTALAEELVDNAFGFSGAGTPVRVRAGPDGPVWRLRVTDAGRGMTPQQVQQLGAFQQHERKKFEQQGLGLGLALVRKVVAHAGGEFRLESEAGQGTTAHVALPLGAAGPVLRTEISASSPR